MPHRHGWIDKAHNAGRGRDRERAGRPPEDRGEEAYRSERGASGDASYGHRGNYEQVLQRDDEPQARRGRPGEHRGGWAGQELGGPSFHPGGPHRGLSGARGRPPEGYRRPDERIREDLREQISECPDLDASDVEVKVQDGEVTLSGTVRERRFKHQIEALAERVSGVTDVRNEIRLQRGQQPGGPAAP
ncbi:BON domain-containing protein [Sorangium cellulosum]|jgi:hypothetical protein|nr:BON domain-containing protein [Sorangium cellulosum]